MRPSLSKVSGLLTEYGVTHEVLRGGTRYPPKPRMGA